MKKHLINISLLIFSSVFFLILAEFIVRKIIPSNYWQIVDVSKDFWDIDDNLGWRNKKKLDIYFGNTNGEEINLKTNIDGIYPHDAKRYKKEIHKNIFRVALLGDSTVMGRSVNEGKRLSDLLESKLNKQSKTKAYEVFSIAVEGYNIEQVYASHKFFQDSYRPDLIIYGICHNDWDDIGAKLSNGFKKPIVKLNDKNEIILINAENDVNLINKNNKYYSSNLLKRLVNNFAIYRIIRLYGIPYLERYNFVEINKNKDYLPISRSANKEESLIIRNILNNMYKDMKGNILIYVFPDVFETDKDFIFSFKNGQYEIYQFRDRLLKLLKNDEVGKNYIEILPQFIYQKGENSTHLLPHDHHLNSNGFKIISEIISQEILDKYD